ncbi:MAG: lasso peptide biosynthesis B2 protein [Gallionella sp.]|nr:lasso peptide biosynthesis B2 protein [Gallionella sp.]
MMPLHKLPNLMRRPRFELFWLLPAWLLLGFHRLIIKTIPLRYFAPHFGTQLGVASFVPLISPVQTRRAIALGKVIQTAARYTPWESNCFPQALTARLLLAWYNIPYSLFFGVQTAPFAAHAWVAAGRVRVTGGESFASFAVVSCFTSAIHTSPAQP